MKSFKKYFRVRNKKIKTAAPLAPADVQEIDKEIDAIYGILVDVIGSE